MNIHLQLAGRFKFTVRKANSNEPVSETPWMDNMILNGGLNRFGVGFVASRCLVGSGALAPVATQTSLQTQIAHTDSITSTQQSANSIPPYRGRQVRTFRFSAGVAQGTIREVGIGWGVDNDLWCRALVVDANGTPTSIVVLADEILDVTYELRIYPDLVDKVFESQIGADTYNCVLRAATVTGHGWTTPMNGLFVGESLGGTKVYNGALGPVTEEPSGVNVGAPAPVLAAYVNNSLQRTSTTPFDINTGNLPGGITAWYVPSSAGSYKVAFSPAIPKDNTKSMTLGMTFSWGRYSP